MQFAENSTGQDRTFLKYQISTSESLENVNNGILPVGHDSIHDVEIEGVKNDRPVTGKLATVTENSNPDLEKGVLQQPNTSGSDISSIADPFDEKDDFPEGGLKAWSVVLGAFCGSFSVFGIINSTAVLMDYFTEHQLKGYTSSQIGWIFGLALFLTFFCGTPVGPIYDCYGPRALIFCGSILLVLSMFLLGECTSMLKLRLIWNCH